MDKKDIIIIGGGASGMMCAITAKENHPERSVVILEKQNRLGRKLLSTGNGRCNLSNLSAKRENYNGSFAKYTDTVFEKCPVERVLEKFKSLGLITHSEQGRLYPVSNHAASVLDVLRFRLDELGVEVLTDEKVIDVKKEKRFIIKTENKQFSSEKVVFCSGSKAAPKLGSESGGIEILKKLGHKFSPLSPALCPVSVENKLPASIKGVRAAAKVTLFDGKNKIKEEVGELQFTEKALSGICVFNLSSSIKGLKNPIISVNLAYGFARDFKSALNLLENRRSDFKNRNTGELLTGIFRNNLAQAILKQANIGSFSRKIKELSDNELKSIAKTMTDWRFIAKKPDDFNTAQVCSGGISGDEIEPKTMESKIIKNLYICGEAVDLDGECGGFNLQFAFASGIIAGESL